MKTELINDSNFSYYVDRLTKTENEHPKFLKFLEMAKSLSEASKFDTYKIGAVLAIKGKVISRGFNSYKTHPKQKLYNRNRTNFKEEAQPFMHAEMSAIQKLRTEELKNVEMYIYRTGKDGKQKMCRPCAACMKAIKDKGIRVIHYTTNDGIATEYLNKNEPIKVKKARGLI